MPYKYNPITGKMDYYEPAGEGAAAINPYAFRRSGRYYNSFQAYTTKSGITVTRNQIIAMPFFVPTSQSFDRIGVYVNSSAVNGKARVGIYSDDGVYPSTPVLLSNELDCSSTGFKEDTISVTLNPALYWLVLNTDGDANMQFYGADYNDNYPTPHYRYILGVEAGKFLQGPPLFYRKDLTYGPLPNPFPTGASYVGNADVPHIYLRKA